MEDLPGSWVKDPYELLGLTRSSCTPERAKVAYRRLVLRNHPDKGGDKETTARLNVAYASVLEDMSQTESKRAAGIVDQGPLILGLNKFSEDCRQVFIKARADAEGRQFHNNLTSFYTCVFDRLVPPKLYKVKNDAGLFNCDVCSRSYLTGGSHDEWVYGKYLSWFLSSEQKKLGALLVELSPIGRWAPHPTIQSKDAGVWGEEKVWTRFSLICQALEGYELNQLIDMDSAACLSQVCYEDDGAMRLLRSLIHTASPGNEGDKGAPEDPGLAEFHLSTMIVLPAFLKVCQGFTKWRQLAFSTFNRGETQLSLLFCKINALEGNDDIFLELCLHALTRFQQCDDDDEEQDFLTFVHLCFLLSCSDPIDFGKLLADKGFHWLASQYFYANLTGGAGALSELANEVCKAGGNAGAEEDRCWTYLLPLLQRHLTAGDVDKAVDTIERMAHDDRGKFWDMIKCLVSESQSVLLASHHLNQLVLSHFMQVLPDLLSSENKAKIDEGMWALCTGIPSALHVLEMKVADEDEKSALQHTKQLFWKDTVPQALEGLVGGGAGLDLEKYPDLARLLSDGAGNLATKHVLDNFLRPRLPSSAGAGLPVGPAFDAEIMKYADKVDKTYGCTMMFLLGTYHLQMNNGLHVDKMMGYFEKAALMDPFEERSARNIAILLTSDPLVHERVLSTCWNELDQLREDIENEKESFKVSDYPCLLTNLAPKEYPKWAIHLLFWNGEGFLQERELRTVRRQLFVDRQGPSRSLWEERDLKKVGERELTEDELAERGYRYLSFMESPCTGGISAVSCLIMALSDFLRAMEKAPNLPTSYAYRAVILQLIAWLNGHGGNDDPPFLALYVSRVAATFSFAAGAAFSRKLKNPSNPPLKVEGPATNFILEDEEALTREARRWQMVLNLRMLWPFGGPEIYSSMDSVYFQYAMKKLYKPFLTCKTAMGSGEHSRNIPPFLAHHALFAAIYRGWVDVDVDVDTEEEEKDAEEHGSEEDPGGPSAAKKEPKLVPFPHTAEFKRARASAMYHHVERWGYSIGDIERMMKWPLLRRNGEDFLDTSDRSLAFPPGEKTYCRFLGFDIDANGGITLQMVEATPSAPGLFTAKDVMEIIMNNIGAAWLSFDEVVEAGDAECKLKPEEFLFQPHHPYFKVRFGPPSLCGTGLLMTMYHLDLLAKTLTTGQEVSAKFPHEFRSLEDEEGLLKGLPDGLKDALKPLKTLKKANLLRPNEDVHRFWFQAEGVQGETANTTTFGPANPFKVRYGDVLEYGLRTAPMERDEAGKLVDKAMHGKDKEDKSPEDRYVAKFNSMLAVLGTHFPIILRYAELVKIMAASGEIRGYADSILKVPGTAGLKVRIEEKWTGDRPYSNCTGPDPSAEGCSCSYLVPAVYKDMKVTDGQKVDYVMELLRAGKKANDGWTTGGIEGLILKMLRAMAEDKAEEEQAKPQAEEEPKSSNPPTEEDAKKDPRFTEWPYLEDYKVYGGVLGRGTVTSSTLSLAMPGTSFRWEDLTAKAKEEVNFDMSRRYTTIANIVYVKDMFKTNSIYSTPFPMYGLDLMDSLVNTPYPKQLWNAIHGTQRTFSGLANDTAAVAKGLVTSTLPNLTNHIILVPHDSGGSNVFELRDTRLGRVRPDGTRAGLDVLRIDGPHAGYPEPHININPKVTGLPDPHTSISRNAFAVARGVNAAMKVALPVSIVLDAARLSNAVEDDGGTVGINTVTETATVGAGWGGALAGAKLGADVGIYVCKSMTLEKQAVCVGVGAVVGGVGGGVLGEEGMKKVVQEGKEDIARLIDDTMDVISEVFEEGKEVFKKMVDIP